MYDAVPGRRGALTALTATSIVAAAPGCDAATRPGPSVEVRDSGGIELVATRRATALEADPWRIDEAPIVRIGGRESEDAHRFHRVVGAVRSGEALVVADGGAGELRWFALDGTHRATAAGRGEGP